ncbi:hypothetical protein MS3_00009004 [Schistosoma haematobium]|uniref:Uncharacterized protein n=1 Tax=Schistosoma haematobium TaxID=6185 RepID=A0A6A5DDK3_SCHHA|nr:hypothetical protein MS3_00009004 [Schistosoma haematobium]KAH9580320.1 hypothetical protein MS3_00009004 [Schistosoma haematobium]
MEFQVNGTGLESRSEHQLRCRYNHKTAGYFAAVDLSEVIQNSLIDDDHLNVINNKEMNQSLNQPNLNDRLVPINLLDDYVTSNTILHGQQSTLNETFCCEYKKCNRNDRIWCNVLVDQRNRTEFPIFQILFLSAQHSKAIASLGQLVEFDQTRYIFEMKHFISECVQPFS